MPVTAVRSKWRSGNLVFHESVAGNGALIHFGEDASGLDIKFFGATTGAYMHWDESGDKLIFDKADIHLGDTDYLKFGDATGGDVSANWTGSILEWLPAADDTGSINIGDGTTDIDLKVFLGSATEFVLFDVGNSKVKCQAPFEFGSDGAVTAALLHGAGTSATRTTTSTAGKNFLGYWVEADASVTSGDTRGLYMRLYISGAGSSGEAGRFFCTVNEVEAAVGGTVNGIHSSLSVTAGGSISGAGNALRATLGSAASTTPGGTLAAIQADSDFGSGTTLPSACSFIRFTDTGSVGIQNLFDLSNVTDGSGELFSAHVTDALSHSIKVIYEGTPIYIMCTNDSSNRT